MALPIYAEIYSILSNQILIKVSSNFFLNMNFAYLIQIFLDRIDSGHYYMTERSVKKIFHTMSMYYRHIGNLFFDNT